MDGLPVAIGLSVAQLFEVVSILPVAQMFIGLSVAQLSKVVSVLPVAHLFIGLSVFFGWLSVAWRFVGLTVYQFPVAYLWCLTTYT